MLFSAPKTFKLDLGLDRYNPPVVPGLLAFYRLENVEPRMARLFASRGYSLFQDLELETGDKIVDFAFYALSNRQFHNFYAFSRTSIYWFDFSTELFDTTPIYTDFLAGDTPYVLLPWYNCLYVTKMFSKFVRVERKIVTEVEDAPFARYGIVANSHLFLGGTGDVVTNNLARTRWSDLDAPESWGINPNESEADFFDLEPDSRQITGVSYQRGSPLVYAENNIWIARSVGLPGGFRFEPLFPGIGNLFHDAVIRNKEIDYFIGEDNFYALNGLQLVPIGDTIFRKFMDEVKREGDPSVRGYVDSRKDQVFWIYTDTNDDIRSIVYNYKERKWSERDAQNLSAFFNAPLKTIRGYDVIDDISDIIDDVDDLVDDPNAGYPVQIPQLVGTIDSEDTAVVGQVSDEDLKMDGDSFAHVIETFDFFFDNIGNFSEIHKALIEFVGGGLPDLTVQIGTRPNLAEDVTWSTAVALDRDTDSSLSFYIRRFGRGKYIRFRLSWGNTEDDKITQLLFFAIEKVEETPDDGNTEE